MTNDLPVAPVSREQFQGMTIHTVNISGARWVVLRPSIEELGLDYSAQLKKLRAKIWPQADTASVRAADGKTRSMVVVTMESWAMLLANVDDTRVAPAARVAIARYQRNAARTLAHIDTITPYSEDEPIDLAADLRHIYVLQFSSRVIKVGQTSKLRKRLHKHSGEARNHGHRIERHWASVEHATWADSENALITFCWDHFGAPVQGSEYFASDNFDEVTRYAATLAPSL